jgi:hypothetical protein
MAGGELKRRSYVGASGETSRNLSSGKRFFPAACFLRPDYELWLNRSSIARSLE